jgi:hypothetical protein
MHSSVSFARLYRGLSLSFYSQSKDYTADAEDVAVLIAEIGPQCRVYA